jgi:hypothetical protein
MGWRRRPGSSALRGRGIRPIPGYAHRPRASRRDTRGHTCRTCRAGEREPGEARRRYHAVGGTCDVHSAAYHRLSPTALREMARHVGGGPRSGRATRRTTHHTRTLGALLSGLGVEVPRSPVPARYNASSFRTARTPDTRRATSEARTLVARDGAFPVRVTIPFSARTSMLAFFRDASFVIAFLTSVSPLVQLNMQHQNHPA